MYPTQLLTGNMSLTGLLTAAPQQTISTRGPIPLPSHSTRPTMLAHSTGIKHPHSPPGCNTGLDWSRDKPASCLKEPPQWRWKEEDSLEGQLKGAHQEAFGKDSNLVKWIRCTYFRAHPPEFDNETTHNLTHIFKEMVDMAGLLNTEIHLVQDPCQARRSCMQPIMQL